MAFRCPYCGFRITVKTAPKPGKYTPKCPKCTGKLTLTVPTEPDAEWTTAKIAGENPTIPEPEEATMASPPPSTVKSPIVKSSPKSTPAPDPDATFAHTPSQGSSAGDEATGMFTNPGVDPDATYAQDSNTPREQADDDRTGVFEPPTTAEANDEHTVAHTEMGSPATKVKPKEKKKSAPESEVEIPETLGGYEVKKELGRGGMGAVFLARQVSLDRPVALKVMNSKWASDPVFLARFTREAYAAAQLVHHNVVQIYDIGEQQGINFFSMEFVEGKSLGDVIKKEGQMSQEAAISHIIQAARGLKFAHDRGMIHRDVKPDNLMLNVHGVVKVADLGLVKTAAMTAGDDGLPKSEEDVQNAKKSMTGLSSLPSDITMVNTAMGSPSYMSPEQCRDASHVDPRADIYSLGCTLYALLSGKPPFQGRTVFELMAKHASEPAAPIGSIPPELNAVVLKSLAKDVNERHQTMDEFIHDLEKCLPGKGGPFKPTEEHLTILENCVSAFRNVPAAKIRSKIIPAFFIGCMIAMLAGGYVGGFMISFAVLAMLVQTVVAYFVVDGIFQKTYVFRKVREWFFGARLSDWALGIFSTAITIGALFALGLLWVFLGTTVLSVGLAFIMHFLFDRGRTRQRRPIIEETEKMLKRFRVAGMEEDQLRLFVAQNSVREWEEFYEALFGYEAKLVMREKLTETAGDVRLPRYAAWREPLLTKVTLAQQSRQEAKAKKLLKNLEAKKLQAEGVSKKEAEEQAEAAAEQIVEQVAVLKVAKPSAKPVNLKKMMDTAVAKAPKKMPKKPGQGMKNIVRMVTGLKFRVIVSIILIAAGAVWAKQFEKAVTDIAKSTSNVVSSENSNVATASAKKALNTFEVFLSRSPMESFPLLDCLNPMIAGIILLTSIFYRRPACVALCLLGTVIALVPHHLIALNEEAQKAAMEQLTKAGDGGFKFQIHQATMALGLLFAGGAFLLSLKRDR